MGSSSWNAISQIMRCPTSPQAGAGPGSRNSRTEARRRAHGDVLGRDPGGRTILQLAVDDWTLERLMGFEADAAELPPAYVLPSFTSAHPAAGVNQPEAYGELLRGISSSAERKSGSRLAEDGAVNSRVFKKIIDDGCLCNDGLSADYYGGFLASSRTKDGLYDANVPSVSMINRMSSDHLHGHWILSALLLNNLYGSPLALHLQEERKEAAIYIP